MKCFECLRARTTSPEIPKTQTPADSASPGGKQAAVGVTRSDGQSSPRSARYAAFEEVLKSDKAMDVLRQYMESIQQDHLIDFLADVQRFRSAAGDEARQKQAQHIFHTYLRVLADRELSLDSHIRSAISSRLQAAPADLFDEADGAVTEDIRRDVFPRFLRTPLFERLAGLA